MEIIFTISRILAWPLVVLVVIYQKTLSPDHGFVSVLYPHGFCKFHPTCSEYARETLLSRGILGIPKIINRIIKCRPGVVGGVDLPINQN
jgi:putative membrane protein insertion efficiency factor